MAMRFLATMVLLAAAVPVLAQDAAPDSATIPAAPEVGGPQVWEVTATELNLRAAPSTGAEILDRLPSGTLLSNLGCEAVSDRLWCDVQRIEGGPRGHVAFAYLRPAAGPDGQVARGLDQSAVRAGRVRRARAGALRGRRPRPVEAVRFRRGARRGWQRDARAHPP